MNVEVCFCTCPDEAVAEQIARTLVAERLVACVNVLPGIRSVYRWEGKVTSDSEVLLILKTERSRRVALQRRLVELHPYELPELLAVEAAGGLPGYLDWVVRECQPH